MSGIEQQDIFIGVAAVADYRPATTSDDKIKKRDDEMNISMVKNPDILAEVAALPKAPFCVGFAAETNNVIDYARAKLERKKLNLIAANHVGGTETGFGVPDNAITLISPTSITELPRQNKYALARSLIEEIIKEFKEQQ
jgi:phosphopantothenoylcysteine decarboxylase/phosphopantothenate--cysteine ligase